MFKPSYTTLTLLSALLILLSSCEEQHQEDFKEDKAHFLEMLKFELQNPPKEVIGYYIDSIDWHGQTVPEYPKIITVESTPCTLHFKVKGQQFKEETGFYAEEYIKSPLCEDRPEITNSFLRVYTVTENKLCEHEEGVWFPVLAEYPELFASPDPENVYIPHVIEGGTYNDVGYMLRDGSTINLSVEEDGVDHIRLELNPDSSLTEEKLFTICILNTYLNPDSKITPPEMAGCLTIRIVPKGSIGKSKLSYKGKIYESDMAGEDMPVYRDRETARLVKSFQGRNDLTSVYVGDVLYVYDEEDMSARPALKKITSKPTDKRRISLLPGTRALSDYANGMTGEALGFCSLYDDTNFSDTHLLLNLTDYKEYYDEYRMLNQGLNDKVSSLAVIYNGTDPDACAVLTVWEDSNFNFEDNDRIKHRVSFIATKDNPHTVCSNLKNVQCIGSSKSWNDLISSISFYFGNYGTYWKNY